MSPVLITLWPDQNGNHFGDISKFIFCERKFLCFVSDFAQVCSKMTNWQWVNIGSGYGLVPNWHQAITWTNIDPVYWCIYASTDFSELSTGVMSFFALTQWLVGWIKPWYACNSYTTVMYIVTSLSTMFFVCNLLVVYEIRSVNCYILIVTYYPFWGVQRSTFNKNSVSV